MATWSERTAEDIAELKAQWERKAREPTPLPWRVIYGLQWDGKTEEVAISGAPPYEDTVADNMEFYPHAIKVADAEFIVLRVNAHDSLVAALEEARPRLVSHNKELCAKIDAALALARGGK